MRVDIGILGSFRVLVDGEERTIAARKHRSLVAEIALRGRRSRAELIARLWPESDDERGRESLRHALYRVRAAVGSDVFDGRGDELSLDASVVVDARQLERTAASERETDLESALGLYRGPLCAELDDADAEVDRVRLSALAAGAAERLATMRLASDPARAAVVARRATEIDPYREGGHRLLLRALAESGDVAVAAVHYRRLVATLRSELGVGPSSETAAVYASIAQGARAAASVRRPSLEPPAELIGRRSQYADAMRVVSDAIDARGGAALLVGEAGAGKSRLLDELAAVSAQHGLRVLRARAVPAEGTLAFQLWVDALREHAPQAAALPAPWPSIIAALLPEASAEAAGAATPELQRTRLFEAVVRLLARLAESLPTLIVLDDLHHADDDSLHLFHYVARSARGRRLAILGAARPRSHRALDDVLASLAARAELREVGLGPLTTDAVVELLARSGVRRADLAWLAPRIARWSGGNPLYALEALRALVAQGRLRRDGAEWTWAAPIPAEHEPLAPELPPDVRQTILARVGTLPEGARRLIDLAATIGTHARLDVLSAVSGRDSLDVVDELRPALDGALLRERRDDRGALEFVHELIRDATYHHIPSIARAAMHRRVADALERLGAARGSIALHLAAAGESTRAVDHWLAAARDAATRFAHDESVRAAREALAALGPASPRRAELLAVVGDAEMRRGAVATAVAAYDEALGALDANAADERASLGVRIARAAKWYERHPRQLDLARAAVAHQREHGARGDLADALIALGWVHYIGNDADEALAAGEEASALARAGDLARLEAEAIHLIVRARWLRGEALASIPDEDLERLTARLGDDELTCALYETAGPPLVRTGQMDRALAIARRELEIARRIGSLLGELKAGEDMLEALCALGRYAEAVEIGEQVRADIASLDLPGPWSLLGVLANALVFAGLDDRAAALCDELIAAARRRAERPLHQDFALSAVSALMEMGRLPDVGLLDALRPTCRTCNAEWQLVAGRHAALRGDLDAATSLASELEASLATVEAPRLASGPSQIRALVALAAGHDEEASREADHARALLGAGANALRQERFERDLRARTRTRV